MLFITSEILSENENIIQSQISILGKVLWILGQLVPKSSRTQVNSYPSQLVPKSTRTQVNSYPG